MRRTILFFLEKMSSNNINVFATQFSEDFETLFRGIEFFHGNEEVLWIQRKLEDIERWFNTMREPIAKVTGTPIMPPVKLNAVGAQQVLLSVYSVSYACYVALNNLNDAR